jgi:hypothetical protein
VVQVPEKFIEAVQRREKFVQVAEVVLAELPGCIALCLQRVASVTASAGMPTSAPACPTVVKPGADRQLAGNEIRATAVQLASA